MREYSLYLFDFDNTLFDTRKGIEAILRSSLPMLGVEYNGERFSECLGLSMDQVYGLYCSDGTKYEAYRDRFMEIVRSDAYKGAEPFPETEDVLRSLKEHGKHVGIVSGKMRFKIEDLLEANGMSDIPETIVGFYETEAHKPSPDPILKGMSSFDVPGEDVLYVGDSPNDALAAEAAGVDCVIVVRGARPDGLPPRTAVVGSLRDIIPW